MSSTSAELPKAALRLLVTLAGMVFVAAVARADIVPPRPASCPDGSIPETSHSGPFCWVPGPCKTDEGCKTFESDAKSALVCRPTAVCVRPKALFRKAGGKTDVPEATGSCEGGATCGADAKCEREKRCAPPVGGAGAPTASAAPTAAPSPTDAGPTPPSETQVPARPSSDPTPSTAPRSSCFCSAGRASIDGAALALAAFAAAAFAHRRRATRAARRRRATGAVQR